eukprot:TRINITY_DN2718_c0_g1_i2.p3 TRINITY_DN2718_c0_g1~~TRINITY_DN2718_c0_g1_i2.p3  ORF type:complete len:197 (-),score=4.07 TRINITY_DN2718_c0_g1_i2:428-1018(-)
MHPHTVPRGAPQHARHVLRQLLWKDVKRQNDSYRLHHASPSASVHDCTGVGVGVGGGVGAGVGGLGVGGLDVKGTAVGGLGVGGISVGGLSVAGTAVAGLGVAAGVGRGVGGTGVTEGAGPVSGHCLHVLRQEAWKDENLQNDSYSSHHASPATSAHSGSGSGAAVAGTDVVGTGVGGTGVVGAGVSPPVVPGGAG